MYTDDKMMEVSDLNSCNVSVQAVNSSAKGLYTILHTRNLLLTTHDSFCHSPGLHLALMIPHVLAHPGAQVHPVKS